MSEKQKKNGAKLHRRSYAINQDKNICVYIDRPYVTSAYALKSERKYFKDSNQESGKFITRFLSSVDLTQHIAYIYIYIYMESLDIFGFHFACF